MRTLGIMVETINRNEYKLQCKVAREAGFHRIILFTPENVNLRKKTIKGWVHDNTNWSYEKKISYPNLIYDRGNYEKRTLNHSAVRVKRKSGIPFLGDWLGNNKWIIHQHIAKNAKLKPHLIPSKPLKHIGYVYAMIEKHKKIIIKPVGSHDGVGIKKVFILDGRYCIKENKKPILRFTKKEIYSKLIQLKNKRNHLIQKWVELHDDKNRIYDIRVLMQKNEKGKWHLTGMGIRYAKKESITSNLATGGVAVEVTPFLSNLFGANQAKALIKKLQSLSYELSNHLEHSFRKRLVELGLDFGIDRKARIWIIEANTKPGKKLFGQLGKPKAFRQSLQLPIYYAGYLVRKSKLRESRTM